MPDLSLITTLLLVFATAILGGLLARKFNLPSIVGYILGGFIVGAWGVPLANRQILELVANVGVTLLLFTLGVEFSFHRLRAILRVVAWAATIQIMVTMLVLLVLLIVLGFAMLPALFIAAAGALSSTAVVIKILSERGELESLPGEITTGWLVVQDLAVIPMMIILPAMTFITGGTTEMLWASLGFLGVSLGKAAIVLVIVIASARVGISRFLSLVARIGSRELFLLSTIGLVLLAATTTYSLGLSAALGAFIAGLLVAETSQNHAVFAEVRPLRDLFATIFFVTIGMIIPMPLVQTRLWLILSLGLVVMLVKGGLVGGLLRYLGYHRKTAFLTGVAVSSMSEFGFILSAQGVAIGALTPDQASLLAAVTFTTMLVSAPLLAKGHELYSLWARTVGRLLPKATSQKEEVSLGKATYPLEGHVVLCGFGRVGKYIGRALVMASVPFLVVDYNHTTVASLKEQGIPVIYGDPADKEVLDYAEVDHARAIVIAIADLHTQELIIGHALTLNKKIKIICRTHHEEDQPHLKSLGVQTVVQPEFEAALTISEKLLAEFGASQEGIEGKVSRLKIEHGIG